MEPKVDNVVTWLLVVLGWVVVHHFAQRREQSKEWRALIRKLALDIEEVTKKASAYHRADSRSIDLEEEILWSLNIIGDQLSIVKQKLKENTLSLVGLEESITMNNFQSKDFARQGLQEKILRDIAFEARSVINKLYQLI